MNPFIVETIKTTLKELEEMRSIHLLMAVESGSRGWGFPSEDSDYDCRFVYVKSLDDYLTIGEPADHISLPVDAVYDIAGWDIKKFLIHIRKSNPTVWGWLQSPIVYEEQSTFRKESLELAQLYFNEKTALYHYKSLAYKKAEELKMATEGKLKAYFYALRSTLSCAYILKYHSIPPMTLKALLEGLTLEEAFVSEIWRLVELKKTVDESYTIPRNTQIMNYIEQVFVECDAYLKESHPSKAPKDNEALDTFFRKWIKLTSI